MTDKAAHSYASEIVEEHRTLRQLLASFGDATDTAALTAKLKSLLALMEQHFTREEYPDGLYETIEGRAPRLGKGVEALFRDHAELLQAARDLIARGASGSERFEALQESAAALIDQLQAHEERENALLQDSLVTDIGGDSD